MYNALVHTRVYAYGHTYIHMYMHAGICVNTCMHAPWTRPVHAYTRAHVDWGLAFGGTDGR